jgi:hypothetical protein
VTSKGRHKTHACKILVFDLKVCHLVAQQRFSLPQFAKGRLSSFQDSQVSEQKYAPPH